MVEKAVNGTNYRASFLVPDFVEIQRRSFSQFLEKGIIDEFSKINPIKSDISNLTLTFYPEKYLLILPDYTIREAILQGKTYSCKLYLPAIVSAVENSLLDRVKRLGQNTSNKRKVGDRKSKASANLENRKKTTPSMAGNEPFLQKSPQNAFDKTTSKHSSSFSRKSLRNNTKLKESLQSRDITDVTFLLNHLGKGKYLLNQTPSLAGGSLRATLQNNSTVLLKPQQIHSEVATLSVTSMGISGRQRESMFSARTNRSSIERRGVKATSNLSWVLIGSVPLMTKRGHFIVNGSPRVVINQLVRSPGVYFHERKWGTGKKKKRIVYADFVSRRGVWLRIQADKDGNTWARLKKTPKIPFQLFYDAMAACERDARSWTTANREALLELHEEVNPTQKDSSAESGSQFLVQRFKNPRTYDIGSLGRIRLNTKFGISLSTQQLTSQDLYSAVQYLQELQNDYMLPDDIDHLKNRRVRASGELVQGQFEMGVYRLEKAVLGKMRKPPTDLSPRALVNTKPLNGAFREFFGSSPLSQYMDQTNPLAEITQKRRISSLGPGGINRETAGMAIRGIHPTHYGRICPIETPEGKNAGLVNSLTTYTRIGDNGILETPYYNVVHGQVQRRDGFHYFSASKEEQEGSKVAPGDVKSSKCDLLPATPFPVREIGDPQDDFKQLKRTAVSYVAISPIQMISVATSLIPFLEHDDANRALMGSNMQRQAVPLLRPERPLVGTGLEALVIGESGHALQAKGSGYVSFVSGATISVCTPQFFNRSRSTESQVSKPVGSPCHAANIGDRELLLLPKRAFMPQKLVRNLYYLEQPTVDRLNRGLYPSRWPGVAIEPLANEGVTFELRSPWTSRRSTLMRKIVENGFYSSELTQQGQIFKWQLFAPLEKRYSYKQSLKGRSISPEACARAISVTLRDYSFTNVGFDLRGSLLNIGLDVLGRLWPSRRHVYSQPYNSILDGKRNTVDAIIQRFRVKATVFGSDITRRAGSMTQAHLSKSVQKNLSYQAEKPWALKASFSQRGDSLAGGAMDAPSYGRGGTRNLRLSQERSGIATLPGPWISGNENNENATWNAHASVVTRLNYSLQNYHRSNQETCLTQIPAVCEGDWVQRGDLLADCSASQFGELALGKNILIAYLPWEGYNFEDAVVISERLVYDDVYTSVHIQKYEIEIRETRFGFENITSQIPGVPDSQKTHLNPQGIVTLGSWVSEGDILVGKVSPRSSHPLSPYERLAYDIANVEAATTEDTSLRVPKGVEGRVINCQSFKATNIPLEQQIYGPGRVRVYLAEKRKIQIGDKVAGRHGNKGIVSKILPRQDMPYLPNGEAIDMILNPLGIPSRMNVGQVFECLLGLAGIQLGQQFKVTPFDEIYGTEASRSLVYLKLYQARLRTDQDWLFNLTFPGKSALFDGRTGSSFDQWVTIGKAYMLKLVHLVDEKIHARSTGPYSLVTKQPLGGRSKHGGQRLGEMEVWALEGFGAAYTLQEMLTSKSDDIVGREQVVEAILFKGRMSLGNPEAFKVLVRELQSLCLDVGVYVISPDRLRREVVDMGSIP